MHVGHHVCCVIQEVALVTVGQRIPLQLQKQPGKGIPGQLEATLRRPCTSLGATAGQAFLHPWQPLVCKTCKATLHIEFVPLQGSMPGAATNARYGAQPAGPLGVLCVDWGASFAAHRLVYSEQLVDELAAVGAEVGGLRGRAAAGVNSTSGSSGRCKRGQEFLSPD